MASRTQSTAAPTLPTVSESGENSKAKYPNAASSPRSINYIGGLPADEKFEVMYDSQAREFASAIYRNLRVPYLPDSIEGHRELGNFASAWNEAMRAGTGEAMLTRLWDRSVKNANEIGGKRQRVPRSYWKKSPEATWRHNFGQRLEVYKNRECKCICRL